VNEEIPMEPAYRAQLREQYLKPFRGSMVMLTLLAMALLCIQLFIVFGLRKEPNYYGFLFLIVIIQIVVALYRKMANYKRYYMEDAQYGFIIKDLVMIIKVFETPAGINIYWLDHDTIKTFTPDPYLHFRTGDLVNIYYLKHSAEYLAYDTGNAAPGGVSGYKQIGG